MDAKEMGLFIAKLRKEKQTTQAELAKRLHVTDKAVSRWERGVGFPDINTLEPLADALGISLTGLMTCTKDGGKDRTPGDPDTSILASIDIAKSQRDQIVQKAILGFFCAVIGLCAVLYALYLFVNGTWTMQFRGNDGATAMFIAGKTGVLPSAILMGIGGVVSSAGVYILIHAGNNDR